jgi:hypothetical protein
MSADADAVCGAGYGERSPDRRNIRNGYRCRGWDTLAGSIELAVPKLREGSYFPDWLLERRRRALREAAVLWYASTPAAATPQGRRVRPRAYKSAARLTATRHGNESQPYGLDDNGEVMTASCSRTKINSSDPPLPGRLRRVCDPTIPAVSACPAMTLLVTGLLISCHFCDSVVMLYVRVACDRCRYRDPR